MNVEEVEELIGARKRIVAQIEDRKARGESLDDLIARHSDLTLQIKAAQDAASGNSPRRPPPAIPEIRVEVIEDTASLEALRPEWRGLLSRASAVSAFMTWEWLHGWWIGCGRLRPRQLRLVVVREADQVIGLAPFMLGQSGSRWHRHRVLAFLGTDYQTYYPDIIAARSKEAPVTEAVAGALEEMAGDYCLARLRYMKAGALALQALPTALASRGMESSVVRSDKTTHLAPLTGTFDDFVRGVPNRTIRNYLRHERRRLAEAHQTVEYLHLDRPQEVEGLVATTARLNVRRQHARGEDSYFACEASRDTILRATSEFAARGWLRGVVLRVDGAEAGGLITYVHDDTGYFKFIGTDPAVASGRVGHALFAHCIERCIAEGVETIDLLPGDQPYKRWYLPQSAPLVDLTFPGRGLLPLATWLMGAGSRGLRRARAPWASRDR